MNGTTLANSNAAGEGSFRGAITHPWWETAGRLSLAIWLGLPGLLLATGGVIRWVRGDAAQGITSVMAIASGLFLILMMLLSLRGRFGLVAAWLAVSMLGLIATVMFASATKTEGSPQRSSLSMLSEFSFASLAITWIAYRRFARTREAGRGVKASAVLLTCVFLLTLPGLGSAVGQAVGLLVVPDHKPNEIATGQRMPNARFLAPDGTWLGLDKPGVVYVVNFWATWCAPCRLELPRLLALSKEWREDAPVRLLAINTEDLTAPALEAFLKQNGLEGLPVFTDPELIKKQLGFETIPVTLLVQDRRVIGRHVGFGESTIDNLRTEIQRTLTGHAAVSSEAVPRGDYRTAR